MTGPAQHPIVDTVIGLLDQSSAAPTLSDKGRAELEQALRGHVGRPDLIEAVRSLLLFAFFLHHKRAEQPSVAIVEVLTGFRDAVAAAGAALEDLAADPDSARAAQRFLGQDSAPARVDESAPVLKWWQARGK